MSEAQKKGTGAVRSSDADHLDFMSLPLIGLIGVARTAHEGGSKYGRFNYMQGFSIHELLNHSLRHQIMYALGDRSEPHLEHAAWGLLDAIQESVLHPELSRPHLLGPGATITPEMQAHLDENAPRLKELRQEGHFDDAGSWALRYLPEVRTLLQQRQDVEESTPPPVPEPWSKVVNKAIKAYVKDLEAQNARRTATYVKWLKKKDDQAWFKPETVIIEPSQAMQYMAVPGWEPGSTNRKVYGDPVSVEGIYGPAAPKEGETWVDFDDGTRAYFKKKADPAWLAGHIEERDELQSVILQAPVMATTDQDAARLNAFVNIIGAKATIDRLEHPEKYVGKVYGHEPNWSEFGKPQAKIKTGYDPANNTMDGIPVNR